MPITITRILLEGISSGTPNQSVTLTDVATSTVMGTAMCDAAGKFAMPVPYELLLSAVAGGHATAVGVAVPGVQSGGAGGHAGGGATLGQSQPLAGAAGGHGGGTSAETAGVAASAGGHAGATGTPSVVEQGSQGAGGGGHAGGSGTLTQTVPLGGSAGGGGGAGPSTQAQQKPIAAAGGGQAAGAAAVTIGKALAGAAGGHADGTGAMTAASGGGALSAADNFNRANGAVADGSHPWLAPSGVTPPAIVANQLNFASGKRAVYWGSAPATANQRSACSVVSGPAGPAVRMSATEDTCYHARFSSLYWDSDLDETIYTVALVKVVNGVESLTTSFTGSAGSGNITPTLRIEASGSVITAQVQGVLVATYNDASIASGFVGVRGNGTALYVDDWSGGDL